MKPMIFFLAYDPFSLDFMSWLGECPTAFMDDRKKKSQYHFSMSELHECVSHEVDRQWRKEIRQRLLRSGQFSGSGG